MKDIEFAEANNEQTFNTRIKKALKASKETDPEFIELIKSIKYKHSRTPEQQDALHRMLKTGKYRTWIFDSKRLEEIEKEEHLRWVSYFEHRKIPHPGRHRKTNHEDEDKYNNALKELHG